MNATLDTSHSLRTNHGSFSDREVSEEDLAVVIEAATRAANSSARQAYSVVVLDDRDRMAELVGYRASHALVFCVGFHRTVCRDGADVLYTNAGVTYTAADVGLTDRAFFDVVMSRLDEASPWMVVSYERSGTC